MHIDPKPSFVMRTVGERRIPFASELEREPMPVRLGKLAGMTLMISMVIIGLAFFVQLVTR